MRRPRKCDTGGDRTGCVGKQIDRIEHRPEYELADRGAFQFRPQCLAEFDKRAHRETRWCEHTHSSSRRCEGEHRERER